MRAMESAGSKLLKLTTFANFPDFNVQKIGTEQVHQVPRAAPALATYARKDPRVSNIFYNLIAPDKVLWLRPTMASFCRLFSANGHKLSTEIARPFDSCNCLNFSERRV